MKTITLFKVQSTVAIVLFTGLTMVGAGAWGGENHESATKDGGNGTNSDGNNNNGSQSSSQTMLACYAKYGASSAECKQLKADVAEENGVKPQDKCTQAQDKYSTLNSNSQSAQQSFFSAQKEQIQAAETARHATEDAGIAHRAADREYAAKVQAIQSNLPLQIDGQNDKEAQALNDIRSKIIDEQQAVVAANDQLRKAETAVQKAVTKQETTCRSAADAAGKAKKTEIDAAYELLKKEKVNFNATSAAGADKRRTDKRLLDIQTEYINEYKNCLNGSNAAGAQAKEEIADAQADFADAQQAYKDAMAIIAQKQALLQKSLTDADTANSHALANIQTQAQNAMTQALAEYQSKVDQADTKAASATQDLTDQSSILTQQIAAAGQTASYAAMQASQAMGGVQQCNGDPMSSLAAQASQMFSTTPKPASANSVK